MDKPAQNIQDSFLNTARKEKLALTIYLLSGVKLTGRIRSFDKYCLILESGNQEQMIFKHAISTVLMQRIPGRENAGREAGREHAPREPERHPPHAAAAPHSGHEEAAAALAEPPA